MHRVLSRTVAVLVLAALAAAAGAVRADEAEPQGFRGLDWGVDAASVEGLTLIESGDSDFYVREGERLLVGQAELTDIIYGFFEGRFYTVVVEYEGFANFTMILYALEAKYGQATNSDAENFRHYWFFETVDLYIEYSQEEGAGTVFYVYKPIMELREERLRGGQSGEVLDDI